MALQAFLATVDSTRGGAFVDNIMLLLGQADVTEVSHLKAAKLEHFRVCFQITLAFCIHGLSLQGNAGQMGFISLAWNKCGGGQKDGFVVPVEDGELCDDQLQAMFLRALGKGEQKQEHVDIAAKLKGFGLFDHLPSEVWPPMNATHELQNKIKSLVKAGQTLPFVAVDLCKCVFVCYFLSVGCAVLVGAGSCSQVVRIMCK